jgi:hypothetical protein
MSSGGKKKTTMAKLARENRLRERRLNKQTKKDARKHASAEVQESPREAQEAQATSPDPTPAALDPHAAAGHKDSPDEAAASSTVPEQPIRLGARWGADERSQPS